MKKNFISVDYSNPDNWLALGQGRSCNVDTIYFYPTVSETCSNETGVADLDDQHKRMAYTAFSLQGTAFIGMTNVYVPYYRQMVLSCIGSLNGLSAIDDAARNSYGKQDLFDALDYYFDNFNKGKPFILASHSQGSTMIKVILSEYMKKHPEYYERMIAAYAIGFGVEEQYLKDNPHVKFAERETDTGVLISWNTEGPDAVKDNVLISSDPDNKCIAINPINWRRDETYATVQESKGSFLIGVMGVAHCVNNYADARLDLKRGVVVCTTDKNYCVAPKPGSPGELLMGTKSLHSMDYGLYYYDIVYNVKRRIEAYFSKESK